MIEESHILPGLGIVISNYPNKPTDFNKKTYDKFLSSFFRLCRQNPRVPNFVRFIGQSAIPGQTFASRSTLQKWLFTTMKKTPLKGTRLLLDSPTRWGPFIWSLLHAVSLISRSEDKEYFITFLRNSPYVLPCKKCARGFVDILNRTDFAKVGSSVDYVDIVFQLHNLVNDKVKKNNPPWRQTYSLLLSYEQKASALRKLNALSSKINIHKAPIKRPVRKGKRVKKEQLPKKTGCGCRKTA